MSETLPNLGITPKETTPIDSGRNHTLYKITATDGQTYVLKTPGKNYSQAFENEQYIVTKFIPTINNKIVPVIPSVVESHYDSITKTGYLLYKYIPSTPINWNNPETVTTFIKNLAKILSTLHKNQTLDNHTANIPNTKSYTQTPSEQLQNFVTSTIDTLQGTDYEHHIPLIKNAHSYIKPHLPENNTFIHDDIHLPNIRTAPNGEINAIIDWERGRLWDPAYELAKAECRIIDLYARFTQFTRKELQSMFREAYGLPTETFENRLKAYKVIYTIRTIPKMKKRAFQPWKRQGVDLECWQAYEQLIPKVIKEAPVCPSKN